MTMLDKKKRYVTRARHEAYIKEIDFMEGPGQRLIAELLASSPGSGMGRPNDLPAHQLAGEFLGALAGIKGIIGSSAIIDDIREFEEDPVRVTLGCTVAITYDGDDEPAEYTILGVDEVDMEHGRISCWSPIGAALMNRRTGETCAFRPSQNGRETHITIRDVRRLPLDFQYPIAWQAKLEGALAWMR